MGDGAADSADALLRELRWIWLRWLGCRTISSQRLKEHGETQKQGMMDHMHGIMSNPMIMMKMATEGRSPMPDPETRSFYHAHGMLPISKEIHALLATPHVLEADERHGGFSYLNPTLVCPYSCTINDANGPFAQFRTHFQSRDNKLDMFSRLDSLLKSGAGDRTTGQATKAADGGALKPILPLIHSWLQTFATALHDEWSAPIALKRIHIWSGDALRVAAHMHGAPMQFDMMHTSNLVDYCGLLPVLSAFAPLVRGPGATLECEVMMGVADSFEQWCKETLGVPSRDLGSLLP
eukprot:6274337-Prymnesium_polylepis.1